MEDDSTEVVNDGGKIGFVFFFRDNDIIKRLPKLGIRIRALRDTVSLNLAHFHLLHTTKHSLKLI